MKNTFLSMVALLCLSLSVQAQTITFSAKNPSAGVIEIYGTYDGAMPYTFISGISSFSMTFEYPRSQANGGAAFADAAAVTAWNNTFKGSVAYNTTYFTGSSSAGTMGDGGGTPGNTFTALNASTNVSTNVASSGLKSIPGSNFPINTPVLFATITLPTGVTVSSLTMKDWANNRAYGSGAPLYAWSMNFDGATVENVATIFEQTSTTNAPTNGGAANSTSSMTFTGAPLPVEMISFEAAKTDDQRVKLNWATANEQNADYFEVERSTDGKNFNTSIRRMPAAGNSSATQHYQTYDNSPVIGLNIYRLKIVDRNGSFRHSDVRTVKFDGFHTYGLSPNPARDYVVVKGVAAGQLIRVMNAAGQQISETKAGGDAAQISLNNMVPGMYYLQVVQDGAVVHNEKFVKQ